jgi:CelD/BcsL family acetyltransferase involved in cellulose biosynthesis
MEMADEQTCGHGLAEHSALLAKLGELTEALAGNLELHLRTLDLNDENARKEHAAYLKLAEKHRQIGVQLQAIGQEMAGHRDLPMGRHDQRAMSSPELAEAFEKFVNAEQELRSLLQARLEQDQRMLAEMRGGE